MPVITDFSFDFHYGSHHELVDSHLLSKYLSSFKHLNLPLDRISWAFVADLYFLERFQHVDPMDILREIIGLEGGPYNSTTKQETQFSYPPLVGLWHKHFFSPRFIPKNIQIHLGKNGIKDIITNTVPLGGILSREAITEIANQIVTGSIQERSSKKRMTGEWIVFAKYSDSNFYLKIETHDNIDSVIYNNIAIACSPQFPFLLDLMSIPSDHIAHSLVP